MESLFLPSDSVFLLLQDNLDNFMRNLYRYSSFISGMSRRIPYVHTYMVVPIVLIQSAFLLQGVLYNV